MNARVALVTGGGRGVMVVSRSATELVTVGLDYVGMCKRGYGRVVFTSSTAGEKAERSGSAYTASKHGVIGLARAVAQDAGPFGVTSNAVLPGWVRTAMAERSANTEAERRGISVEQVWQERAAIYPQKRVLEPREVAQVIAFLCSAHAVLRLVIAKANDGRITRGVIRDRDRAHDPGLTGRRKIPRRQITRRRRYLTGPHQSAWRNNGLKRHHVLGADSGQRRICAADQQGEYRTVGN
jgi:hypothetical protein